MLWTMFYLILAEFAMVLVTVVAFWGLFKLLRIIPKVVFVVLFIALAVTVLSLCGIFIPTWIICG